MKQKVCTFECLVEAWHDDRLDERDTASVERHVVSCATCTAFARDLDRLSELAGREDPEPSALDQRRGRMQLLRAAAVGSQATLELRWWALAAAACAVALTIVRFGAWQQHEAAATLAPVLYVPTVPTWPTETTVSGSEDSSFLRVEDGRLQIVDLQAGTVHLAVKPLAEGERFVVRTTDAEVEVRGTVFDVSAEAGQLRSVVVHEGKVEVLHSNRRTMVLAGTTWRAPATPPAVSAATLPVLSPVAAAPRVTAERSAARAPRVARAVAPPVTHAPAPEQAKTTFGDGVGQVERGDFGAGARTLDEFARANPTDPRSEDAAFLAAVALQRAGRRAEAAEAARRYLARYPEGFRRREAEAIANAR